MCCPFFEIFFPWDLCPHRLQARVHLAALVSSQSLQRQRQNPWTWTMTNQKWLMMVIAVPATTLWIPWQIAQRFVSQFSQFHITFIWFSVPQIPLTPRWLKADDFNAKDLPFRESEEEVRWWLERCGAGERGVRAVTGFPSAICQELWYKYGLPHRTAGYSSSLSPLPPPSKCCFFFFEWAMVQEYVFFSTIFFLFQYAGTFLLFLMIFFFSAMLQEVFFFLS